MTRTGNQAIPHELNSFIVWLRDITEELWGSYRPRDFQAVGECGSDWQTGTRWLQGLTVPQVLTIEQRWNVKFPEDYRLFLRCLHATDRPKIRAHLADGEALVLETSPGFYNWLHDTDALVRAFAWPLDGLMFDVEHHDLWLASWGPRPGNLASCRERLAELISAAPPLLPLIDHRYLVGHPLQAGNPILSVDQSDIAYYGADIRTFLMLELGDLLGWYLFEDLNVAPPNPDPLPFWGELVQLP